MVITQTGRKQLWGHRASLKNYNFTLMRGRGAQCKTGGMTLEKVLHLNKNKESIKIVFGDLCNICFSYITQIVSLHDKSDRYFPNFGSLQTPTTKVCDRHGKNLRTLNPSL